MTTMLGRGMAVLVLAAASVTVGAAPAQAAPELSVRALAFSAPRVDATTFATNELTFTVKDADAAATSVSGVVTLRMRSVVTGALVGREYTAGFGFDRPCCDGAVLVSGTPQLSTYSWTFGVPSYADAARAVWEVSRLTLADDRGAAADARLDAFARSFTARTRVDSSGPAVDAIHLQTSRPYRYLGGSRTVSYEFTVQDAESGFWKGAITLAGPGGQSVTTSFTRTRLPDSAGMTCGYASSGGDDPGTVAQCGVPITLPADAAAGTWRVASIVVINNAGGRSAYRNPVSPSVTATRNDPLRASDFALDPALADTWRGPADGRLTMKVAGARKGVARVEVDTEGDCNQAGAATATAGGTVTVPLHYFMQNGDCLVKGIAIVDGAGHAAVYGAQYEAPDPGLVARRLPDTTPPVVTGAGVDMTATAIAVTIHAQILTAPLTDADVVVYNDRGWRVAQVSTGIAQAEDGSVVVHVPLPDLETGIYTVGFRLSDAGLLTSEWGMPDAPDSRPVPGGPVAFTIAAG